MTEEKKPSNLKTIKEYFCLPGEKALDFGREYKELTDEDKKQLAEGILDGSFDYS